MHLLHDKTKNGRGVPFGAARRLLPLRLLSPRAAWRATGRDTYRRARFESRYAVCVTNGTLYVRPLQALLEPLKAELDKMEKLGFIEKVNEPSDWVNLLVIAKKKPLITALAVCFRKENC